MEKGEEEKDGKIVEDEIYVRAWEKGGTWREKGTFSGCRLHRYTRYTDSGCGYLGFCWIGVVIVGSH